MEYLPFGETMTDEHLASRNSPFKYNGKEFDEETGNYYYGARYYDPKWSIFISVDPLAEDYPHISSYAYVANNPLKYMDPTGMEIVNGETANREKIQALNDGQKANLDSKYGGDTKLRKKDFATKADYKEYKNSVSNFKNSSKALSKSMAVESKIQAAIDDFRATDPSNFNLVNDLSFIDSKGNEQCIDVTVKSGEASNHGRSSNNHRL
ncbi:RHS repeat-associated core domain-containing protein [bacterium]|nr:MAG: RHS repeat-associated core domain-containing protein [bacterium]